MYAKAKAPSLYPQIGREDEGRPNFLKEDESRLQRLKFEEERSREQRRLPLARQEEPAAIWRLYQETREENEILKKRIALLTEEVENMSGCLTRPSSGPQIVLESEISEQVRRKERQMGRRQGPRRQLDLLIQEDSGVME